MSQMRLATAVNGRSEALPAYLRHEEVEGGRVNKHGFAVGPIGPVGQMLPIRTQVMSLIMVLSQVVQNLFHHPNVFFELSYSRR